MNPGRFYMPYNIGMRSVPVTNSLFRIANSTPRNIGLFSRLTNGIRSVNWGGILSGANKTLNVVNQAIPLVRQAGPMVNNMKSMLRIAKAFGSETTKKNIDKNNSKYSKIFNTNISTNNTYNNDTLMQKKEAQNDNAPNFFV